MATRLLNWMVFIVNLLLSETYFNTTREMNVLTSPFANLSMSRSLIPSLNRISFWVLEIWERVEASDLKRIRKTNIMTALSPIIEKIPRMSTIDIPVWSQSLSKSANLLEVKLFRKYIQTSKTSKTSKMSRTSKISNTRKTSKTSSVILSNVHNRKLCLVISIIWLI